MEPPGGYRHHCQHEHCVRDIDHCDVGVDVGIDSLVIDGNASIEKMIAGVRP